jgi:hypothetical protein
MVCALLHFYGILKPNPEATQVGDVTCYVAHSCCTLVCALLLFFSNPNPTPEAKQVRQTTPSDMLCYVLRIVPVTGCSRSATC